MTTAGWRDWLPELPELPELDLPELELPDLEFPDLELPDLGLPALPELGLPDWTRPEEDGPVEDEGPIEQPVVEDPFVPPEEQLLEAPEAKTIEPTFDTYLDAADRALEDPSLASLTLGEGASKLSKALTDAWLGVAATPDAPTIEALTAVYHQVCVNAAIHGLQGKELSAAKSAYGKRGGAMKDTYLLARVLSPEAYGLAYPSGKDLGDETVDLAAVLSAGRDLEQAVDAEGNDLGLASEVGTSATLADNAAHLAELLAATTLSAQHMACAHDLVAMLYPDHADAIAGAGLPASSSEVYRTLQKLAPYANQQDNVSRMEKSNSGGTCNLTGMAMAMMAAGVPPLESYKGVPLTGMQYEEKLLTVANMDGQTDIAGSTDVWKHVMTAFGAQYLEVAGSQSRVTWEQWQNLQSDHLDKGHGIFMSIRGHIVRLQEVVSDGLIVDDPFYESHIDVDEYVYTRVYKEAGEGKPRSEKVEVRYYWDGASKYSAVDKTTGALSGEVTDAQALAALNAKSEPYTQEGSSWTLAEESAGLAKGRGGRDINTEERNQGAKDYAEGADAKYDKYEAINHLMRGMYAVWR